MGEVVTGKFEFDIDKLAGELQASVHDPDGSRAAMVRIRADHGSDVLYKAARCASRELIRGITYVRSGRTAFEGATVLTHPTSASDVRSCCRLDHHQKA
jgi:hypothetical protein